MTWTRIAIVLAALLAMSAVGAGGLLLWLRSDQAPRTVEELMKHPAWRGITSYGGRDRPRED